MSGDPPSVGVVVPMYNAAATIDETLDSVLAQTYPALDVVVVDDGSDDDGPARVEHRAASDPRLRLIRQHNCGVAAARNTGAAATRADYLAFIDADDIWAPRKIALQMEALLASGGAAGVAYSWFALIDRRSHVISLHNRPLAEGQVLGELFKGNFVGNGSSLLMLRSVFDAVGGFDTTLREHDAQGCEDLAICLALSEVTEFRVVPRFMTGYRLTHDNMSSDVHRMLRSANLVLGRYRERFPLCHDALDGHLNGLTEWLLGRAVQAGRVGPASQLYALLLRAQGRRTLRITPGIVGSYVRATAARWLGHGHESIGKKIVDHRRLYRDEQW